LKLQDVRRQNAEFADCRYRSRFAEVGGCSVVRGREQGTTALSDLRAKLAKYVTQRLRRHTEAGRAVGADAIPAGVSVVP
jgi:hypothetical protein